MAGSSGYDDDDVVVVVVVVVDLERRKIVVAWVSAQFESTFPFLPEERRSPGPCRSVGNRLYASTFVDCRKHQWLQFVAVVVVVVEEWRMSGAFGVSF